MSSNTLVFSRQDDDSIKEDDNKKPEDYVDTNSSNQESSNVFQDAYIHESTNIGGRDCNIKGSGVINIELYREQYKKPLYKVMLFFSVFLVAFAYGLDNLVRFTFQYQATSKYKNRSSLRVVNCIKTVIGAAGQLGFARTSDIFGRNTVLHFSLLCYVIGTLVQCKATTISRFGAGTCIYQVGLTGIQLMLEVIAMDFSDLNWRLLASFIPAFPFVINIWISGLITANIGENWPWGIGMWAFIMPCACVPLILCMLHMRLLTKKYASNEMDDEFKIYKELSWSELLVDVIFWRLDLVGFFLICSLFGCVLIPLTLAGGSNEKWKLFYIIVPEVIGWVVVLSIFLTWEAKMARHPILSWDFIHDRGIIAALVIAFFINFNWYLQGDYMFTVLQIAFNQTVLSATRITSLYSFVCVISGTLLGCVIVKARRTKPFIIFGISCWFLAFGLLFHFCDEARSVSGIIGSLCLLGFGAGFFTYTTQASIQAAAKVHSKMAVATALYLSIYSIGSAVGSAISGAIWTKALPKEVYKTMDSSDAAAAYRSPFLFVLDNPWGTSPRERLVKAYCHVQKTLCLVGLCFCIPLLVAALFLRNHRLESAVSLESIDEDEVEQNEQKHDLFYKIKSYCETKKKGLPTRR